MSDEVKPPYHRVKAVAARWAVSPSTIYREIEAGRLAAVRIGTSVRVSDEALLTYERRYLLAVETAGGAK